MEPLVLPLKPQPLPEESAAAFNDRMLNWWRECDPAEFAAAGVGV